MWERVMETLTEMMHDRSYKQMKNPAENIYICKKTNNESILIFLCKSDKFNIESIKYLIYLLQEYNTKHGLFVYKNIITSSARKAIDHLQDYTIEMFEKRELMYNITKHRLFCKHERPPKDLMMQELKQIDIHNLPVLLRNDIVARYYQFIKGDLIRIIRKNGSIAYRIVK